MGANEPQDGELRQAQRMQVMGEVTLSVAHDFNNLLTVIVSSSELALGRPDLDDETRGDFAYILDASRRATHLTQQLLAFGTRQGVTLGAIPIDAVLADVQPLLKRLVGRDIVLRMRLGSLPALVHADRGLLEQVVVNLASNARDAMPDGGSLELETLVRDHQVILTIRDSGSGMDATTRSRIFDRLFTTKSERGGTGLGLYMVRRIVDGLGGTIDVWSEPEYGSCFTVALPVSVADAVARPDGSLGPYPMGPARGTILLVDSADVVRQAVCRLLESAGYTVLEARDSATAMAVSGSHRERIDLVLTDVRVPGLDGRKLAERLISERPTMRALLMSSMMQPDEMEEKREDPMAFIQKPFARETLVHTIETLLTDPNV